MKPYFVNLPVSEGSLHVPALTLSAARGTRTMSHISLWLALSVTFWHWK